jgi:hypothetical protein
VSLSLGLRNGVLVTREIVRPLAARSSVEGASVTLEPGTRLENCRIVPNRLPDADPYEVEFDAAGRRYTCPLFRFQPRTQAAVAQAVETVRPLARPALQRASVR